MVLLPLLLSIFLPIKEELPYSWKEHNPVPLENLRVVEVPYWGFDDQPHTGKLIVHEKVALEVSDIFNEVFEAKYPIEKMSFVDDYLGVDELSAADNNSYSFCSRENTSIPGVFSKHSYGLAIDINPFYNPYHKGNLIIPIEGSAHLDRTLEVKGMIKKRGSPL